MGRAALECRHKPKQLGCTGEAALCGFAIKQLKVITMKLRLRSRLVLAAAIGLAFTAGAAHAQLLINLKETATFGVPVGGTNYGITNNGSSSSGGVNTSDVITTGTPVASPFSITYNPLTSAAPTNITLNTGTLNVATLVFNSTISPLNTFGSLLETVTYDFDNNGTVDLTEQYDKPVAVHLPEQPHRRQLFDRAGAVLRECHDQRHRLRLRLGGLELGGHAV